MSDYINFTQDIPSRCERLLKRIEKGNRFEDLTVTGLLMVAALAINIPYERLRPVSENMMPHPSGDDKKYPEAAQQIKQLLTEHFIGSCLCPINTQENWQIAKLKSVQGAPDTWNCYFKKIDKEKKISSILAIIRNALAHGNIFTKSGYIIGEKEIGKNRQKEILEIIFVSVVPERDNKGKAIVGTVQCYNCISVTPTAFKHFLNGWFSFIKDMKIYPFIVNNYEDTDIYEATG